MNLCGAYPCKFMNLLDKNHPPLLFSEPENCQSLGVRSHETSLFQDTP